MKDRVIAKIVGFLARAIYRRIDVHWAEPPHASGPQLTVANHFGGVADAIVLLDVLPRRPSIIARDVIWRVPLVKHFMNWIGALPVHKPEDGAGSTNDQMFASCYAGLRDGGALLIFPEGVTRNEPSIARVKTGAARIVLGARASGAQGIVIQPAGIHYEDKAALRSRIVVQIGERIDVDEWAADLERDDRRITADDRDAVDRLTARIDTELRRVAPDYDDWGEANDLTAAAEITVRSQLDGDVIVPIELRDRLANALSDTSAERRSAIRASVQEYERSLDAASVTDASFTRQIGAGGFAWQVAGQIALTVILLPFALVGAAINLIPFLIVKAVGLWRVAPSVLSTVKPIVAFVVFGIAWAGEVWAATSLWGGIGFAAAIVLIPVYSAAVLLVAERVVLLWRLVQRWRARHRTAGITTELGAERNAVIDAVLAA